jgi:Tol biopolymer transport system component
MYNCDVRLAVVLCVAACGGGDPAATDATVVDAPPTARCSPTGAFGPPKELTTLNGPTEDLGGRLSNDELTILFSRTNADQTWDIWTASRGTIDADFGTPEVVGSINTIYSELWPSATTDGKALYFMSDRVTPGTYGIFVSTRASTTAPWGPPAASADLMTGDATPYLANATSFYFAAGAGRMGAGMNDIYRATLDGAGKLTMIDAVIGGVDSPASEDIPVVTADELHIYFARSNGTDFDVFEASRSSLADGFGAAAGVPGISTTGYDELPSWISPDGCHLYYSSAAGVTGSDLFMIARGS